VNANETENVVMHQQIESNIRLEEYAFGIKGK
jgi:hypothetical protein